VLDGVIEIIGSTVASKLGRTSDAGIATLCKAISVALDPDTGCMVSFWNGAFIFNQDHPLISS
jgi:hypothetical protein